VKIRERRSRPGRDGPLFVSICGEVAGRKAPTAWRSVEGKVLAFRKSSNLGADEKLVTHLQFCNFADFRKFIRPFLQPRNGDLEQLVVHCLLHPMEHRQPCQRQESGVCRRAVSRCPRRREAPPGRWCRKRLLRHARRARPGSRRFISRVLAWANASFGLRTSASPA